jgi:beta-glucanase (GH16 family)
MSMKKNIILLFLTLCAGSVLGQSFLTTNYNSISSCSDEFNTSSLAKWCTIPVCWLRLTLDATFPGDTMFSTDNNVNSGQPSTISNPTPVCKLTTYYLPTTQIMTDENRKQYHVNYTIGSIYNRQQFKYGYYEARVKLPQNNQAITSTFWLWGSKDTTYGEIDILENTSGANDHHDWGLRIHSGPLTNYYKYNEDNGSGDGSGTVISFPNVDLPAAFHTYGLEWQPDHLSFFLDGTLYKTFTKLIPNNYSVSNVTGPYYLLFNAKPSAQSLNPPQSNPEPNGDPFEIDWFHYYKRKPILSNVVYNPSNNTIALTVSTQNDEDAYSWVAGSNIISGATTTNVATIKLANIGTSPVTVSATGAHPAATSSSPFIFKQNPSAICGNLAQNTIYVTANLVAPTAGCSTSNAVVTSGTVVTFAASNSITLNGGFEVQLGAEFNALTK